MHKLRQKRYAYFVGIDVSRNKLDVALMNLKTLMFHKVIKNEPEDVTILINELKAFPKFTIGKCIFCLEHTGIYNNHLLSVLKKFKANVMLEASLQIRNSLGVIRNKYDKIDSIRIAKYAYNQREKPSFWIEKRTVLLQLSDYIALRSKLTDLRVSIAMTLKEQQFFIPKSRHKFNVATCHRSIIAIKEDLSELDEKIDKLISDDDHLKILYNIITSVPHIGRITALQIIICTNEFKDINDPKKFACYAGIAPFIKESGIIKRKGKVSHIANKKMKALLHLCAIGATRNVPDLREYYQRKTQIEGKPKMSVFNAIRNKLILRVFACVNQKRNYTKEFTHLNA